LIVLLQSSIFILQSSIQKEALVAGNRVSAVFSFKNGAHGFFASGREGTFGVELVGTKGRLVCVDGSAGPYRYPLAIWTQDKPPGEWTPIEVPENELNQHGLGRWLCARMITELIRCIESGDEHPSSGYQGRAALELIMFASLSLKRALRWFSAQSTNPKSREGKSLCP
jgi:predicted dehydrogenase